MPQSINGIGTGLVTISSKRTVNGHLQFDAMETVIFLFIPLIPYKLIHILSMVGDQYHSVPLKWSGRLVLKGMINGWSNILLFGGGCGAAIAGFAFFTMPRPMNQSDWTFLTIFTSGFVLGLVFKAIWYMLDQRDRRIKDIIVSHDLGSSDPFDWPDDIAEKVTAAILQHAEKSSLLTIGEQAMRAGEVAKAMLCLRLAMRDPIDSALAVPSFEQLLTQGA